MANFVLRSQLAIDRKEGLYTGATVAGGELIAGGHRASNPQLHVFESLAGPSGRWQWLGQDLDASPQNEGQLRGSLILFDDGNGVLHAIFADENNTLRCAKWQGSSWVVVASATTFSSLISNCGDGNITKIGNRVYFHMVGDIWYYDISTQSFGNLLQLPYLGGYWRYIHASAAPSTGKLYVLATNFEGVGIQLNQPRLYEVDVGGGTYTYTAIATPSEPFFPTDVYNEVYSICPNQDGKIYMVLGTGTAQDFGYLWSYDIATDTWIKESTEKTNILFDYGSPAYVIWGNEIWVVGHGAGARGVESAALSASPQQPTQVTATLL